MSPCERMSEAGHPRRIDMLGERDRARFEFHLPVRPHWCMFACVRRSASVRTRAPVYSHVSVGVRGSACVSMCACVRVRACALVRVLTRACDAERRGAVRAVCARVRACARARVRACARARVRTCLRVCVRSQVRTCVCVGCPPPPSSRRVARDSAVENMLSPRLRMASPRLGFSLRVGTRTNDSMMQSFKCGVDSPVDAPRRAHSRELLRRVRSLP